MWKEIPRTRKKVLSSHHVESSRLSLTTVSLEVTTVSLHLCGSPSRIEQDKIMAAECEDRHG